MLSRDYVQSLERGIATLLSFGADNAVLTLSEVAQRAGIPRAAARRFLLTLVELGYVGTDEKHFWLLPRILDLGHRYLSSQSWWQLALPVMEEIAGRLRESCSICVLDETEVVYVAHFAASRFLSMNLSVGSRLPAHPTALGRVLLSGLPDEALDKALAASHPSKFTPQTTTDKRKLRALVVRVRVDRYSIVDQELEVGLIGLAVPILAPGGTTLAALGISVPANRVSKRELMGAFLPVMREASDRITFALGQA